MILLLLTIRLHAPWCHSLKDKRSQVKRLTARLHSTFNVSACEVGEQDIHTIIQIGVAAIAFDSAQADSIAENVIGFVEGNTEAEVVAVEKEYR